MAADILLSTLWEMTDEDEPLPNSDWMTFRARVPPFIVVCFLSRIRRQG
jgi:hypothetical protein